MSKIEKVSMYALLAVALCAGAVHAKEGMVNFNSKTVSFSYPITMGTRFSSKKVAAARLESPDEKPDGVAPEHWEVTFAKSNAHVYVFPTADATVKDFRAAYPPVADAVKDLGSLLKNKSATPTDIPFLPWQDASSPIHSHVKYVPFKNGSGVRFVATYQIEPEVISNDGLVYTMQGLSADGKYYVSAFIPVTTRSLPNKSDAGTWSKEKYEEFSNKFSEYSAKEKAKLDRLSGASFSPSLTELDSIIESLKVQ